jgi:hypothetical protein
MKRGKDAVKQLGQAVLLLILAGCTVSLGAAAPEAAAPRAPAATPAPTGADRLVVSGTDSKNAGRAFVLDAASGAVQRALPSGYISPDWSTLYEVTPMQDQTGIRAYDLATGQMLRETTVAGLYDVPALPDAPHQSAFAPDGASLVLLGRATPAEEQSWNQTGKPPATRILVLDTSFKSPPRSLELAGNFWFDALGPGGSLYLIEVLDNSAGHAPRYQVRRYDLAAGRLDEQPVIDKREPGPMNGNRLTSLPSTDGVWLYSLYGRDTEGPFVHVLNLDDRYAVCVDLPLPAAGGDFESALMWSLALSPDGSTLYAVNGALGQVAAINTETFEVRAARLPRPAAQAPGLAARIGRRLMPAAEAKRLIVGGAAVSPDGQTLYAVENEGLASIVTGDLTLQGRYMAGWPLTGLALTPNGAALYAVSAEKSALLRLGLPLTQNGPAPEQIPTAIRPATIVRVISDR